MTKSNANKQTNQVMVGAAKEADSNKAPKSEREELTGKQLEQTCGGNYAIPEKGTSGLGDSGSILIHGADSDFNP